MIDPYYFYQKHILGIIPRHQTPSMRIGSAIDSYLTGSRAQFKRLYKLSERRNLKSPPEGYTELSGAEYEAVMGMINAVKDTEVYKDIKKNYKSQRIFSIKQQFGIFRGLKGLPDWFRIIGNKAIIVDLKTTSDINKKKYQFQAHDMFYYFQQANYRKLIMTAYPQVEETEHWHLVVKNNFPYLPVLFQLDQDIILMEFDRLEKLLSEINSLTHDDFKPRNLTWKDANKI